MIGNEMYVLVGMLLEINVLVDFSLINFLL